MVEETKEGLELRQTLPAKTAGFVCSSLYASVLQEVLLPKQVRSSSTPVSCRQCDVEFTIKPFCRVRSSPPCFSGPSQATSKPKKAAAASSLSPPARN